MNRDRDDRNNLSNFSVSDYNRFTLEKTKMEAGMLRRIIGIGEHARLNGSFLFVFGMVAVSGVLIWAFGKDGMDYCKSTTIPLITLGLGYFAASGKRPEK